MTNNEIAAVYYGVDQVDKIYLGDELVWPTTPPEPVYSAMPLTFEIISGGTIKWKTARTNDQTNPLTIQYAKNGGEWTNITSTADGASLNVSAGDKVELRGDNSAYGTGLPYNTFSGSTAIFDVYGNIMSLINSTNYATLSALTENYTFKYFFRDTKIVNAENLILPATTLRTYCYEAMFYGCTELTTAPELPATTLVAACYENMFRKCTSLTTAPELKSASLVTGCYSNLFSGCTSLNYVKCIATDFNTSYAKPTLDWLAGVSSSGTFVKHPDATWPTGNSGIPRNWTVIDATI